MLDQGRGFDPLDDANFVLLVGDDSALPEVQTFTPSDPAILQVYVGGEQAMVAGCRRHLVGAGVPKTRIQFTGQGYPSDPTRAGRCVRAADMALEQ